MIKLSQRDSRWAQLKLGKSNLSVGRFGCTTTCISMLSDYFGCYTSPAELAKQEDLYTIEGLIKWWKLNLSKMKYVKRFRSVVLPEIVNSLYDPDTAVILEVDFCHWVVAIRYNAGTKIFTVVDPWKGTITTASLVDRKKTYKITGSAHFARKTETLK